MLVFDIEKDLNLIENNDRINYSITILFNYNYIALLPDEKILICWDSGVKFVIFHHLELFDLLIIFIILIHKYNSKLNVELENIKKRVQKDIKVISMLKENFKGGDDFA